MIHDQQGQSRVVVSRQQAWVQRLHTRDSCTHAFNVRQRAELQLGVEKLAAPAPSKTFKKTWATVMALEATGQSE